MKKMLIGIKRDIPKSYLYNMEWKLCNGNTKSMIFTKLEKMESQELVKTLEKYNESNFKDKEILKSGYTVFKNNVHKYTFDQINKVIKLYNTSQLKEEDFILAILNYITKRIDALPLSITVNIFHNLVKSGLKDSTQVHVIKQFFLKNVDKLNSLDMTIILNAFTILQEQLLGNSNEEFKKHSCGETEGEVTHHLKYNDLFLTILQKIKEEETVHSDLSVVNAVLILNMMSRINMCNYDIFKFFTKKYFKNLKEKDLEPHHYTLLLNSFAKCNIHINILKHIIKYMNNEHFINTLSYVNIMNALHYMAKFNYKNKYFVQNLKKKVETIIDEIPQREFSNIVWALAKLKQSDPSFNCITFNKIEKMIHTIDPMSIAQMLDALRRNRHEYTQQGKELSGNPSEYKQSENESNKNINVHSDNISGEVSSSSLKTKTLNEISEIDVLTENGYCKKEKHVVNLLIKKYLECLESCSLHVLTQVPFCCLQLNCSNYEIYLKSLEMLKKKKKKMNTLNLIYAKYFIRIYIEKQESSFQKLPRHIKQFAKEILSSDGES